MWIENMFPLDAAVLGAAVLRARCRVRVLEAECPEADAQH
jgi:hypothetical protein